MKNYKNIHISTLKNYIGYVIKQKSIKETTRTEITISLAL